MTISLSLLLLSMFHFLIFLAMSAVMDPIYFLTPAQRTSLVNLINHNVSTTGANYPCDNLLPALMKIVQSEGVGELMI